MTFVQFLCNRHTRQGGNEHYVAYSDSQRTAIDVSVDYQTHECFLDFTVTAPMVCMYVSFALNCCCDGKFFLVIIIIRKVLYASTNLYCMDT